MELVVANADITQVAADLLVMKHANGFRGADEVVARTIGFTTNVKLGEFEFHSGRGTAATEVLFIGVGPLRSFRYEQIQEFGRRAITLARQHRSLVSHLALTIHGPGYGLDLDQAFLSMIAGLLAELKEAPSRLNLITVADRSEKRCDQLFALLQEHLQEFALTKGTHRNVKLLGNSTAAHETSNSNIVLFGSRAEAKPRLFIAMPFAEEFTDEFEIGFRDAAKASDFICERLDVEHFTGDIMTEIKKRIVESHGVLALLNGHNPNVFLEIGFAFAHNKPTILVAKEGPDLPFDVSGHRCIRYKSITHLREVLTKEIAALKSGGVLVKSA
jgi:hypothetical protein